MVKLHETPEAPGLPAASHGSGTSVLLRPRAAANSLNSPVSPNNIRLPRSIASRTGRAGTSLLSGKVIHKIIEMTLALNLDS